MLPYSPFMIHLHLQNRLISYCHCSTYYNTLLYVCEGEGYCELVVNFADFLFIVHVTLLHSRNERERRSDSVKHLSLNHDQAHTLVV